ncbi:hypothetical protein [Acinetobacter sp. SWAC57]|uniref:hypothetical protein n=1 Tax=Acinetobacter sp. SWAC57 TaxID=2293834 RepID=UPI000E5BF077|nr:hypothetical protein [Acinetobacter sp. SWAC57]RGD88808.1 hypothetical protein DYI96_14720 [Acinetobacter sp. SWAC57]
MNKMTKIALATASILSVGALTACQSTQPPKDMDQPQRMHGHDKNDRRMSPEQREQFKEMRAEHKQVMQDMKKACDGKAVGTAVQIKAGEQNLDGTCAISFKPNRDEMKRGERPPMEDDHAGQAPMQGDRGEFRGMHMQHGEPLTDAKRAELTKQYAQRLAERQARQEAMAKACQGQPDGKSVQIKVGTQTVDGKCMVHFQPKPPVPAPNQAS